MNLLKSRLEIEVSEYKFPVLISEVENRVGQYTVTEYNNESEYNEDEKADYVISKFDEMSSSEIRDVLSYLYQNRQCEFDEVLRDEDCYGIHINGDSSRRDTANQIYHYVENDAEIYHTLFERIIKSDDFHDLVFGSIDSYNKQKAFRLAIEILKHIDEILNI